MKGKFKINRSKLFKFLSSTLLIFFILLFAFISFLNFSIPNQNNSEIQLNLSKKSINSFYELNLTEKAGIERQDEPITLTISSVEEYTAHNDSIRVIDTGIGVEIDSQVWYKINYADQNFENDNNWGNPSQWLVRESLNMPIEIIPHYFNWGKVVYCRDDSTNDYLQLIYNFPSYQTSGNVSFLVNAEQTNKVIRIGLAGTSTYETKISFEFAADGHFKMSDGSNSNNLDIDTTYIANQWYQITLAFDCSTDIVTTYIDGIKKSEDSFAFTSTNINQFYISTYPVSQNAVGSYLAWMDYSWAPNFSAKRYDYLKSFKVSFLADLNASTSKIFNITYNNDSLGYPSYTEMMTGTSSITDSHGTVWGLATTVGNHIGDGVTSPEGAIVPSFWSFNYADGQEIPEFVEKGSIFCTVFQDGTNFYKYMQIFDNGYTLVRMKDDSYNSEYLFACTAGMGADEIHYSTSSSWSVRDPCYLGGGSGDYIDVLSYDNTYDGKYFINDDGKSWIFAQVIDTSQPEADDFTIRARITDNTALPIVGRTSGSQNLNPNGEYQFWYACLNGGSTDASQRAAVNNLHTQLIIAPLYFETTNSWGSEEPQNIEIFIILIITAIIVISAIVGVIITYGVYKSKKNQQDEQKNRNKELMDETDSVITVRSESNYSQPLINQELIENPRISSYTMQGSNNKGLQIKRQYELLGGFIRIKCKIINKSVFLISKVRFHLELPEAFVLRKIEPKLQERGDQIFYLDTIPPGNEKTIGFTLEPLICGKEQIYGTVYYLNYLGEPETVPMLPLEIKIVCPLFFTEEEANIAKLNNLMKYRLTKKDERSYSLPKYLHPRDAIELLKSVIQRHHLKFVSEIINDTPTFEAQIIYYGKTKIKKNEYIILGIISEQNKFIKIIVTCNDDIELTGLLAELGSDLRKAILKSGCINLETDLKNLRCPACWAPLDRCPEPGEAIKCSYCNSMISL
ncbi:MAG: hypothetical protein EAX96_05270 [Candidatus Lokiarchaeota archaeon]|nr:hypothetical protein [Candidatus Lokiarchaeota archaeon]